MGSLAECRIEGFICRLCSAIDRNVIHIYSDEGLIKKLEQKINVYLKINLDRSDPLPKVICLQCDEKLEQHHRFIQRVIQNQKKIHGERLGERPIIPLLEEHLRVRVLPVTRADGTETNTYNIQAITSSESESSGSSSDEDDVEMPHVNYENNDDSSSNVNNENPDENLDSSSSSSSSSISTSSSDQEREIEPT